MDHISQLIYDQILAQISADPAQLIAAIGPQIKIDIEGLQRNTDINVKRLQEIDHKIVMVENQHATLSGKFNLLHKRCDNFDQLLVDTGKAIEDRMKKLIAKLPKSEPSPNQPLEIKLYNPPPDHPGKATINGQHKLFPTLLKQLALPDPVYIYGPTGSGKTRACSVAAKALFGDGRFNCLVVNRETGKHEIFGYTNAHGDPVDGAAYSVVKDGGIFLVDEIDNGNANVNVSLKQLNDLDEVHFPGRGRIPKHPNFRLVACANTIGNGATLEYIGRNQQDKALLDIFNFFRWPYDLDFEYSLAWQTYLEYGGKEDNRDYFNQSVKTFRLFRKAIDELKIAHILSPRSLIKSMKLIATGAQKEYILASCLFKGLDKTQQVKIIEKVKTYANGGDNDGNYSDIEGL